MSKAYDRVKTRDGCRLKQPTQSGHWPPAETLECERLNLRESIVVIKSRS